MSFVKTIGEYLTVIKNGIQNGDKIIEALAVAATVKNGKISEGAMAEILKRKDICEGCPFNSKNAKKSGTYASNLPYEHCILCTCRLGGDDTKEYCLSCQCGISVWNEKHGPTQQMELKWGPYDISKEQN
jgi:hypothetical protein